MPTSGSGLSLRNPRFDLRHRDEVLEHGTVLEKLADKGLKNADRNKLEKRLARLDEEMAKMKQEMAHAENRAKQEREAVDRVEAELLEMFANPELRKRYFAIVDLAYLRKPSSFYTFRAMWMSSSRRKRSNLKLRRPIFTAHLLLGKPKFD